MPRTIGSTPLEIRGITTRLVTSEILYQLPDFPSLVQEFIWQEYDRVPELPRLWEFLKFWELHIDGPLVKVSYAYPGIGEQKEIRVADALIK